MISTHPPAKFYMIVLVLFAGGLTLPTVFRLWRRPVPSPPEVRCHEGASRNAEGTVVCNTRHASLSAREQLWAGTKLNLNTVSANELMVVPGIGAALGQRIVAYRNRHGPFLSLERVLEVRGVGPKMLKRMRDYVEVR